MNTSGRVVVDQCRGRLLLIVYVHFGGYSETRVNAFQNKHSCTILLSFTDFEFNYTKNISQSVVILDLGTSEVLSVKACNSVAFMICV